MYTVHVLFVGYSHPTRNGDTLSNCTCTLVKGPKNIVVDTMTPWDGPRLVAAIERHGLRCDDVDYVVSTHGHSDHVGNNNLFLTAEHVVGRCVSYKDTYYADGRSFNGDGAYEIDDYVRIVSTPGHTLSDVSVVVQTAELGSVGIVGDLFENEHDVLDESIWLDAGSENPDLQRGNRKLIMDQVDWIVPGHGNMFATKQYQ